MSGGVDSSVCAALLKNDGYEVLGITLDLFGDTTQSQADAKSVCDSLEIEHTVFDLKNEFKGFVIDNFINEYINGRTPNPCIVCNREIKFGEMLKLADKLGCDKIATGHYAKIIEKNGRFLLCRGDDRSKDQSYVLYCLTQKQLSRTVFPLASHSKDEVRETAEGLNLVNANKKDSQDICFVPDGDYAAFIEKTANFVAQTGNYLDINGKVLGQHKGVIRYTIGQRKGLGIALGAPKFVTKIDAETNRVTLGDRDDLLTTQARIADVRIRDWEWLQESPSIQARIRYKSPAVDAVLDASSDSQVTFASPVWGVTPGQSLVMYKDNLVIGGGIIQ